MTDKPRRTFGEILEEAQRLQIERRSKLPVAGATLYNGDKAFTDMVREQVDASARFRQRLNEIAGVVAIGGGGLSMTCLICGKQATRFANWSECTACNMKRLAYQTDVTAEWCEPHDAHVRARAAQPIPVQPERRFCACGQELRRTTAEGQTVVFPAGSQCGDCRQIERRYMNPKRAGDMSNGRSVATAKTLDARIAAAQPKAVDADPTQAWGAGATPGYEWEGT